jgi:2TM domain
VAGAPGARSIAGGARRALAASLTPPDCGKEQSRSLRVGLTPAQEPARGGKVVTGRHLPIAARSSRQVQGTLRPFRLFVSRQRLDRSGAGPVVPAGEEETMRGRNSEPVELRPGITVREEARMAEIEKWAWARMRSMRAFYTHLTVFVGINFILFLVDASTEGAMWFYIPLLAWGFLLALHGLHAYDLLPWTTAGWEQRKVRELVIARLRAERGLD